MKNQSELWVIFKLSGSLYAINSDHIEGISQLPEKIVRIPESPSYVKGITKNRNKVSTLLDMRILFGEKSIQQEYAEFCTFTDQGLKCHTDWVEAFKTCVQENIPFPLAKDPHKCAFGIWHDSGYPLSAALETFMTKLEDPHNKLHKELSVLENYLKEPHSELLQTQIESCLFRIDGYTDQITAILHDAKDMFLNAYRTMVINMHNEQNHSLGLVVDEIIGVENIGVIFSDTVMDKMEHSELIQCVANDESGHNLLLLLNEETIFQLSKDLDHAARNMEEAL